MTQFYIRIGSSGPQVLPLTTDDPETQVLEEYVAGRHVNKLEDEDYVTFFMSRGPFATCGLTSTGYKVDKDMSPAWIFGHGGWTQDQAEVVLFNLDLAPVSFE